MVRDSDSKSLWETWSLSAFTSVPKSNSVAVFQVKQIINALDSNRVIVGIKHKYCNEI